MQRIKAFFAYSKTILVARLYALAGILVALHDLAAPYVASTDLTPLTARLPSWAWPVIFVSTGVAFEWLRRVTSESLDDKRP